MKFQHHGLFNFRGESDPDSSDENMVLGSLPSAAHHVSLQTAYQGIHFLSEVG